MGGWNSFVGMIRVRIVSAAVNDILQQLSSAGAALYDIQQTDELTVEVTVLRCHYRYLSDSVKHRGDELIPLQKKGVYWQLSSLKKRPVLIFGMLLLIVLAVYLPTRILFVVVDGNINISSERIISQAENIGIRFGASRRMVRSEQIKNALLAAVPDLQWAGVNTYGCVAVISVRERNETEQEAKQNEVRSIIAKCDGVIQKVTAYRGDVRCKVGQAVKTGDILVSGYTDCGLTIRATAAKAEVYAQTLHEITAVLPQKRLVRQPQTVTEQKYSIIIGKKLINLYNDSGISDTGCVKMYKECFLTLPGGFRLPLALVVETSIYQRLVPLDQTRENMTALLSEQTVHYLTGTMVAGQILSEQTNIREKEDLLVLEGEYNCLEMIGQIIDEEIIYNDE